MASSPYDPSAARADSSSSHVPWGRHALERTIDEICDRYEQSWSVDETPRIEDWLAGAMGKLRDELTRELVLTDVELHRRHAGAIVPARYDSLYEERPQWLADAIAEAHRPGSTAPTLAPSSTHDDSLAPAPSSGGNGGDNSGGSGDGNVERVDPLVGAKLGNYQIIRRIARGGMGVVYEARDTKLDRLVALKTIVGGSLASLEAVRRFQSEAQSAARIEHPGIVPIHDVSSHNEIHYYVMGLVEGESLQAQLERESFTMMQAVSLVERIARAVAHAHRGGIVHRDLKPANVLIDKDGQPRITDFGLAKQMDSDRNLTVAGQVLGTPGYMAPEQASGAADVGAAADIYAIGAILYALLTGEPPFSADNYLETLQLVQTESPQSPREKRREIPKDLETVCLTCLAKLPAARYESAEALADDLRRVINGERVLARPWSVWTRLGIGIRRRPALAITFLSLVPLYAWHLFRWWTDSPFWTVRNHNVVSAIVVTWLCVSTLFQRQLLRTRSREPVIFGWAAFELLMLTIFLGYFDGPSSGYVMGYLLLVAAAALRQNAKLVLFVTVASLLSYAGLLIEASLRRPHKLPDHVDHCIMLFVSLIVLGLSQLFMLRRANAE